MSRGVNKVFILGFLGRDPEMRYSQDGSAIVTLSVATGQQCEYNNIGEKRGDIEKLKIPYPSDLQTVARHWMDRITIWGYVKKLRLIFAHPLESTRAILSSRFTGLKSMKTSI